MLLSLVLSVVLLPATTGNSEIPFVRDQKVEIDGSLDDSAWDHALVLELPFETRPGENIPAPVDTEVMLLDNGNALLVAFRAQDPEPENIRAFLWDRDAAYRDDFVGIVLDTFNDGRRALEFFSNPLGSQMDLINDDVNQREDDSWDAIWSSAGQITDFGYVVEMEIPYTAMQIPAHDGPQTWGIDLLRFYPREQRYRLSNNPQDRAVSCYLCQLAKFEGFEHADAGRDLEITPTVTVTHAESREQETDADFQEAETELEPGLDVSWGITPNVTLNATLNPDFSQVEADVAQLDVNRTFTLFFPEKRPFFLEGADFFDTPLRAVFTRNVSDPDYGARVTGKVDRHAFGVFVADDTVTNLLIPGPLSSGFATLDQRSQNAVVRYRRDVGSNSSLGVLFTGRHGSDYENLVGGFDGRLRFTDSDTLTFQYLATRTEYPEAIVAEHDQPEGRLAGDGMYVSYDHNSRNWFSYLRHDARDDDFRADLGFLSQVGYDQWVAGGGRVWHGEADDWYTRVRVGGDWDITHDQDGRVLEREVEGNISVNGPLQSFLQLGGGVRDRFWDGVLFDEDYMFVFGEAQPVGGLYLNLFAERGKAVDFANTRLADNTELSPQVRWNLGRHWQLQLRHTYRKLDTDQGDIFTANQSDMRVAYQFNLRQRLRLTLQYTDIDRNQELYFDEVNEKFRNLGTQLIYSYKVNPRTVLFAGYSDNGLETDAVDDLVTTNRTLFLKVGYAWEPGI